jgi:hypothetical protein
MSARSTICALIALCCTAGVAAGQQKSTPQAEAGEPRADTSGPPAEAPGAVEPSAEHAVTRAAPSGQKAASGAATGGQKAATGAAAAGPKTATKTDRLDLGTATVTGDREQPKVMYIVPWKRSDIGDLAGKPMNSLVDEILAPVDRDVFKREVVYYHAVQADVSQNGAQPKAAPQGEK